MVREGRHAGVQDGVIFRSVVMTRRLIPVMALPTAVMARLDRATRINTMETAMARSGRARTMVGPGHHG
jgi:hypothetical protein